MTSDGIWPDRFDEEAVKGKINQVMTYLVTHDRIVKDSPILKAFLKNWTYKSSLPN